MAQETKTYENLDSFYSDNEQRRFSAEADYDEAPWEWQERS